MRVVRRVLRRSCERLFVLMLVRVCGRRTISVGRGNRQMHRMRVTCMSLCRLRQHKHREEDDESEQMREERASRHGP